MHKEEHERVETGISGYDRMLEGGFFKRSVNLISGPSGAGKTLFSLLFLYEGAKKGEKGIYITFEENKKQIMRDAQNIGIDLKSVEDKITIFDISTLRQKFMVKEELERHDSLLNVDVVIDLIERNIDGAKRIVIDSIVPFSIKYPDIHMFRASLFRMKEALKSLATTSIITTEIPVSSNDISRFGIEDFLADSVTVLRIQEKDRQIKIHKLRGSGHYKEFMEYRITDKGIVIDF
jgi:KaiC/GvpD/RAD55 family RecA-like ATPase